jgi:hypothetical protein
MVTGSQQSRTGQLAMLGKLANGLSLRGATDSRVIYWQR